LDDILDEFDEDESGEIEFPEFIKLASRFVEPEEGNTRFARRP